MPTAALFTIEEKGGLAKVLHRKRQEASVKMEKILKNNFVRSITAGRRLIWNCAAQLGSYTYYLESCVLPFCPQRDTPAEDKLLQRVWDVSLLKHTWCRYPDPDTGW